MPGTDRCCPSGNVEAGSPLKRRTPSGKIRKIKRWLRGERLTKSRTMMERGFTLIMTFPACILFRLPAIPASGTHNPPPSMNPYTSTDLGRLRVIRFVPATILALFVTFSTIAQAQTAGTVSGRVVNAGTKEYLSGAQVTLEPGNFSTLTTSTGEFTFSHVPPGTYSLTASYTGLDARTAQISVTADGGSQHEIQLTSAIYQLDKFVVAGEREGNAAAITEQRNANNVKTVMASDAFGN